MSGRRNLLIAAVLLGAPLAGLSALTPTKQESSSQSSDTGEAEEAIRALRELMIQAGERVEGWNVGGSDVAGEIRAVGADKYYLRETDSSDGTVAVRILTDRPIADFVPSAWRVAVSRGSAGTGLEIPALSFAQLTPRYVLAGRANIRPMGDADCVDRMEHAILYEVPGAPPSAEDKDIPDIFVAMMAAMDGQTVCTRFDGDREKGWRVRDFLPDGRLLLNPDRSMRNGHAVLVPAAPIETLIEPVPPAPAPATPQP